ncbi:MAG: hypothetical protein ACYDER_26010, partial [Ktedonobacteraceae bacterium]
APPPLLHIFSTLLYIPIILTVFSLVGIISWLQKVMYRLRQVRQQLGFVAPLTPADTAEVARWLPASALPLFQSMSRADQQHSLRVCRGLLARDCSDKDMLAAALLHDVGKAEGRVPFWTRPAIVIGRRIAPRLLTRIAVCPLNVGDVGDAGKSKARWRRSLGFAWWHAEVGAGLAEVAGLSERAVLYIRTHHQPDGPAAELHSVDEVS